MKGVVMNSVMEGGRNHKPLLVQRPRAEFWCPCFFVNRLTVSQAPPRGTDEPKVTGRVRIDFLSGKDMTS